MPLESASFINGLVTTNPVGSDPIASGDDHIRLIKSTIKNTFPNVTGAVTATHTQLNNALQKSGDTMTGLLTLSGNPTTALHAVTKQYVDSQFAAAGSGTVTSVGVSGGSTGLTTSGGPVTTSGTITLGGTLAVANGGTGATSASAARTNLGLGTLATANSVATANIADGAVTGAKLSGAQTGTAPIFGARAWVNFDGTGTTGSNMTIRAGGNVASVLKNGVGDYTVTFTTAMPDANYAVNVSCMGGDDAIFVWSNSLSGTYASGSFQLNIADANTPTTKRDAPHIWVVVYR